MPNTISIGLTSTGKEITNQTTVMQTSIAVRDYVYINTFSIFSVGIPTSYNGRMSHSLVITLWSSLDRPNLMYILCCGDPVA